MAAALCLTVFPAMPVFADPADSTENTEDGGSSEEEKPDTSAIDAEIDRLKQEEKQVESQINSIKQQKNQTEGELSATQGQVSSLSGEQDQVAGQMNVTQDSIAQNMASINILLDEISELEDAIEVKQEEYDEAKSSELIQYEAMKQRIRFMYEKGDINYVHILLNANSYSDMINKSGYVEKLYEYDRNMLEQFQETQRVVAAAQAALEEQRAELEESQHGLEEEQAALRSKLSVLKSQYDDYETRIANAENQAAQLQDQLLRQQSELSSWQQEQNKKLQEIQTAEATRQSQLDAAAKAAEEKEKARKAAQTVTTSTSSSTTSTASASRTTTTTTHSGGTDYSPSQVTYQATGSGKGTDVANYALQFRGNPYVYGGTSLTNGADCSGFVMSVYRNFGYSLPRTAEQQLYAGSAVGSLDQARPGDIICYPGHVGIYIGNGQIIHASTAATGIKISNATYRPISGIRRIVN